MPRQKAAQCHTLMNSSKQAFNSIEMRTLLLTSHQQRICDAKCWKWLGKNKTHRNPPKNLEAWTGPCRKEVHLELPWCGGTPRERVPLVPYSTMPTVPTLIIHEEGLGKIIFWQRNKNKQLQETNFNATYRKVWGEGSLRRWGQAPPPISCLLAPFKAGKKKL